MNRLILALFFGVFLSAMVFAGNPSISSANYDPSPVIPGDYFTLWVHVTNNSNVDSENSVFNLNLNPNNSDADYPFYLEPGDSAKKSLGTIKPNQTALVKYRILTSPNSLNGVYSIALETGENNSISKSTPLEIRIISRKPIIKIISVSQNSIIRGKDTELELLVKNIGSSNAMNLSIGISEERTITTTGITVERSIIPLGAAFSSISSLEANKETKIRIPLIVNPSAESKAYFLPIKFDYYDENKTKYSETDYIGLKVFDEQELKTIITDVSPIPVIGEKTRIALQLYNAGTGTAKTITAKTGSNALEFRQSEFFLGSIASGDSNTIILDTQIKNTVKPGNYEINLNLSYKNSFGNETTIKNSFPITIYSKEEIEKGSIVDLRIQDKVELKSMLTETNPLPTAGGKTKITIELLNIGTGTAKALMAKIDSDIFSLEQKEFFIGTLEADDFDAITINPAIKNTVKPGKYKINIALNYKNSNGYEQTTQKTMPITIYSQQEAINQTPQQFPTGIIIIMIIAIIIGFFAMRKIRKQKNKLLKKV